MTTQYKDTPYGRKYGTTLHLIYRITEGRLETGGLYETRESVEENLALFNRYGSRDGGSWQDGASSKTRSRTTNGQAHRGQAQSPTSLLSLPHAEPRV